MKSLLSFAFCTVLLANGFSSAQAAGATAADRPAVPADRGADCNANGVEDAVDIASGYSIDLDGNGIPDECDAPRS